MSTDVCSKSSERSLGGDTLRPKHTSRTFKAFLLLPRSNYQLKPLANMLCAIARQSKKKRAIHVLPGCLTAMVILARGWSEMGGGKAVYAAACACAPSCSLVRSEAMSAGAGSQRGRRWWRGRPYRGGRWRGGRGRGSFSSYGKGMGENLNVVLPPKLAIGR